MLSPSKFINAARQHDSTTANGAVTHSTSLHSVVDMFFLAWASRNMDEKDIIATRTRAVVEDKVLAFKCLFRARDIRGWAGERRFFRTIWNNLSIEDIHHYQHLVAEYGRFDDLDKNSYNYLATLFKEKDHPQFGLLCKRTPRKWFAFEHIRKALGIKPKEFRKLLVEHTNVVEQLMSVKAWDSIDYAKIPSQAFQKYKKAFMRNDEERFQMFLDTKADTIKSATLFPYQLYQSYHRWENKQVINEQWNNLPNYVTEWQSFIPVCDVSGSMTSGYWSKWTVTPMDISVSLGVYLSERNKSVFKDAFITFSSTPKMEYLKGTAVQRFNQLERAHRDMSTNIQGVYELILRTALENNLSQEDLPQNIIIISDMEFNSAGWRNTNHEAAVKKFQAAGYKLPNLIYWNVNGRTGNSPVSYDTNGTALISGASPAIIKQLLGWEDMTPLGICLKTLNSDRYKQVE